MKKIRSLLSIIIPVYNEQDNLEWHHKKIEKTVKGLDLDYEVIYAEDGSSDNSLEIVRQLQKKHNFIRYIAFSKNFGKEAAISAGLNAAKGDVVLVIDADGQHPIELLGEFIKKWRDGYEVITGVRRSNKGQGVVKALGSKLFYKLLKIVDGGQETTPGSTDFRLIDRKVVDQYNLLTERNRIARNLIDWLGYKRTTIAFDANARHAGNATYSYPKLVKLAIDGAIKHSTKPLKLIGVLGIIISLTSLLLMIFLLIENFILLDPLKLAISGTALLAIFLSFLIGIVLTCQGLLALYIENVYYETQNRPLYIIREQK